MVEKEERRAWARERANFALFMGYVASVPGTLIALMYLSQTMGAHRRDLLEYVDEDTIGILSLGVLGAVLVLGLLGPIVLRFVLVRTKTAFEEAIDTQGPKVVWIYDTRVGRGGSWSTFANVRLANGAKHTVRDDTQTLTRRLANAFPNAVLGYTAELDRVFRANPMQFVQTVHPARGIQAPQKAQLSANASIDARIAAVPSPSEGRRTAVDAPFAQVLHAMQSAGLRLTSHIEEGVTLDTRPKNPIRADFETNGARALYWRSPETGLQTVQVVGPKSDTVFSDILNIGYLPVLQSKLGPILSSPERREVLAALGAIAFVHAGKPGTYYRDQLARLAGHPDPSIREATKRATG